jgi:hypothetical protein
VVYCSGSPTRPFVGKLVETGTYPRPSPLWNKKYPFQSPKARD